MVLNGLSNAIVNIEDVKTVEALQENLNTRKNAFDILNYWQEQGKKIVLVTAPAFGTYPIIGSTVKNWCKDWHEAYNFIPNDIILHLAFFDAIFTFSSSLFIISSLSLGRFSIYFVNVSIICWRFL